MIIVGVWRCEYFRSSSSLRSLSRVGVGSGGMAGDDGIAPDSESDGEDKCSDISNEMMVRSI